MAGSREESWWQPPKQFDAPVNGTDVAWDEDDVPPVWDSPAAPEVEPPPVVHEPLEDEVALEESSHVATVGWTTPTGDLTPGSSGNRRFLVGIGLIVVATTIGVL